MISEKYSEKEERGPVVLLSTMLDKA